MHAQVVPVQTAWVPQAGVHTAGASTAASAGVQRLDHRRGELTVADVGVGVSGQGRGQRAGGDDERVIHGSAGSTPRPRRGAGHARAAHPRRMLAP